jgi:PRC-barrel domain
MTKTIKTFMLGSALAGTAICAAVAQTMAPPSPTVTAPAPAAITDVFYAGAWSPMHWRASEAIGQPVYNRADERVGEVKELLIDGDGRVLAAVVGVGGFLGLGERDVAISYQAFRMTRNADGKARLVVDMTKQSLERAPEYKAAALRSN